MCAMAGEVIAVVARNSVEHVATAEVSPMPNEGLGMERDRRNS